MYEIRKSNEEPSALVTTCMNRMVGLQGSGSVGCLLFGKVRVVLAEHRRKGETRLRGTGLV